MRSSLRRALGVSAAVLVVGAMAWAQQPIASDARPVGVVTVPVDGGGPLSSDVPGSTPRGPETERARAAADEMVTLLTEQVREQESQLRRTEARLERAKALLRSLGGFVPDPQVISFLTDPRRVTPLGPKVPYRTPPRPTIPYTQ